MIVDRIDVRNMSVADILERVSAAQSDAPHEIAFMLDVTEDLTKAPFIVGITTKGTVTIVAHKLLWWNTGYPFSDQVRSVTFTEIPIHAFLNDVFKNVGEQHAYISITNFVTLRNLGDTDSVMGALLETGYLPYTLESCLKNARWAGDRWGRK